MKRSLLLYGVQIIEIPRLQSDGAVISASRVLTLMKQNQWNEIEKICPPTTVSSLRQWSENREKNAG